MQCTERENFFPLQVVTLVEWLYCSSVSAAKSAAFSAVTTLEWLSYEIASECVRCSMQFALLTSIRAGFGEELTMYAAEAV